MSDQGDRARSGIAARIGTAVAGPLTLALALAASSVWANPCPQGIVGGVAGYLSLTGTKVVSTDSIDATGAASACLVDGGTLEVAGSLTNNGNLSMSASGGLIAIDPAPGTFANNGTFSALAGTVSNNGAISNSGTFGTNGAVLDNNLGATFGNLGGGQLNLAGPTNNAGSLSNVNGTLTNGAGATLTNTGALDNSSDTVAGATGTIDNHGTVTNAGGATLDNHAGGTITNETDGIVQNQAGATFTNHVGGVIFNQGSFSSAGTLRNDGSYNNSGTVQVAGAITGSGTYVQTAGLTKLLGGSITQTAISIQGGQLLGAGTLNGAVTLGTGATIGAGDPQTMTVHGSLSLGAGTLLVQIAGAGAGQYDIVDVIGGVASLAGTHITFQFLAGFVPLPGAMTFGGFLTADGGITGLSSATYSFLGLSQSLPFQVVANGNGLDLTLLGPVPEPGSIALLLAGLGLVAHRVGALRRRNTAWSPSPF